MLVMQQLHKRGSLTTPGALYLGGDKIGQGLVAILPLKVKINIKGDPLLMGHAD